MGEVGHFRRLILRADAALVGDFRRKPTAIRIRGLELVLDDVRLNPHALLARGEVELLHIDRLTIRHAVVAEEDLERLLADGMRRVRSPVVSARNGYLEIRAEVSGIQIQMNVRLDLRPEANGSLAVWVERVRLGSFSIPAGPMNAVLTFLNPVARFDKQPVEIQIPHLTLEDGLIRLESR